MAITIFCGSKQPDKSSGSDVNKPPTSEKSTATEQQVNQQQDTKAENSDNDMVYVGLLYQTTKLSYKNPSEYCLDDHMLYKTCDYAFNETYIHAKDNSELKKALNYKSVILKGEIKNDLNNILTKIGDCPEDYGREQNMMQIRMDWLSPEATAVGFSTKENLKKVSYFELKSIKEYDGLIFKDLKGESQVTFKNNLNAPIDKLTITGHYEFADGKPYPKYVDRQHTNIKPGREVKESFTNSIKEDQKNFDLWSIEIYGEGKNIKIIANK